MSLRLEMLNAASRAPLILGESTDLVLKFLLSQQNPDGGFRNRAGQSDLYYLPFALGALAAVSGLESTWRHSPSEVEQCAFGAVRYLAGLGEAANLDFVHLCSLARSWAAVRSITRGSPFSKTCDSILTRLELHRTPEGGYNPVRGSSCGSAYGAFLAFGAYQDLGADIPNPSGLAQSVQTLQTQEGGYTNEFYPPVPQTLPSASVVANSSTARERPAKTPASTNASAAAVAVLSELNARTDDRTAEWLLARLHPSGGFLASSNAPAPDLLSTATALHTLATLRAALRPFKERSLDFVDSLWTSRGGFYGHWGDNHLDCEYTFYGLLALGHLQQA